MKQPRPFDDNAVNDDNGAPELALYRVGIPGSANKFRKTQKQFNKAIAKIEAQMRDIEQWNEFNRINCRYF